MFQFTAGSFPEFIDQYYGRVIFALIRLRLACVTRKRVRDASIYASKKISLKFLFLSDIFLFPPIRQQVPILA